MTPSGGNRWVEVTPSQFPHEAEGLALVHGVLPDTSPYRAWSNFEFRDSQGRWHEVDLLVLGQERLHLVEFKYYAGILRGDDHQWHREGKGPEDSPLKLARRKAQYFASRLRDELRTWAAQQGASIPDERDLIPYVQESVFLHHERLRCELSPASARGLYGLDGNEHVSNLPGISELLLEPARRRAIGPKEERLLERLMTRIGLVQRRERRAGSWVIGEQALAEGPDWQDWLAYHQVVHQERARIRFQVVPAGARSDERAQVHRVAEHEYRVMSRLQHDGLLCPRDMVDSDLGVGLVYDFDESWQRLDLWQAGRTAGVPLVTQLSIVRQIGEALQYAHGNKVVHRGLTPRAIWVRDVAGTDEVKVRIGDWQAAGATDAASLTRDADFGVTSLLGASQATASTPGRGTDGTDGTDGSHSATDTDRWLTEGFAAPEGQWTRTADRVRIDVFGLGALAFYVIASAPAARTAAALRTRLHDQNGLDLAVELPQISSELRSLVLKATNPAPSQRTSDVTSFLAQLAQAERAARDDDGATQDPLDATPGAILEGRFRLDRRLGRGSTAVGLLVTDLTATGTGAERVLKVALDDPAAARLTDEAEVLRTLDHPRLVKLVEGPLTVGGRTALLLESAGQETLTDALRSRDRLSLDLLQRYGTDLLDALVALDKAGVDHRDIKPANLGVREGRSDRTKHLVLFDFSLTRAAASATSAGTPPYLDPFLVGKRDRFDSAAERYAAAVVLFEMATGRTPTYGDGESDPATIGDEATVEPRMFDPALADDLTEFFTAALARDVRQRHHTAAAMRAAWTAIFTTDVTTEPDEAADALAEAATLDTALRESGLTPRALSALEPYAVRTVGELLTVDAVRLSRLPGVANSTRRQISRRIKQWRVRVGDVEALKGRGADERLTVQGAADALLAAIGSARPKNLRGLVRIVLGVGVDLDAFATTAQLAAHLPDPVTPARVTQLLAELQRAWAGDTGTRALLDRLAEALTERLAEQGCVLAIAEAVATIADELGGTAETASRDERVAAGLLRLTVERMRALGRAEADVSPLVTRRRDGRVVLLATESYLLDLAEWAGREADTLVTAAGDPATALVPARRVAERMRAAIDTGADSRVPPALREPTRLAQLGAAVSSRAAVSAGGDLHSRDLRQSAALALTFKDFAGGQPLTPQEIRDRVRVRFPALAALPQRPSLDALIHGAGLALLFDDVTRAYRSPQGSADTTGLEPRLMTGVHTPRTATTDIECRLDQSIRSRSFFALGVPAHRLRRFTSAVQDRYAATLVDVTGILLEELRSQAGKAGLPWDLVLAADAAPPDSRDRRGLAELVKRSWDTVAGAVEEALAADGDAPVVVTEAAPLARYDNMGLLARWTDLGTSRTRAVWLIVPQIGGASGASLDGRPVPLATPSQYVALDTTWIDDLATTVATEPVGSEA